jgi:hypothetical protein
MERSTIAAKMPLSGPEIDSDRYQDLDIEYLEFWMMSKRHLFISFYGEKNEDKTNIPRPFLWNHGNTLCNGFIHYHREFGNH